MNLAILTSAVFMAVIFTEIDPKNGFDTSSRSFSQNLTAEEKSALNRAYLEFSMRNYADCLKLLENAPPHPQALNLRGAAYLELGKRTEASEMFRWALDLDPSHFWAQFNLAEIARSSGNFEEAKRRFSALPQHDPFEREIAHLKLVLLDLQLNDAESAKRHLPPWPPASSAGYAAYAAMAKSEGDPEKAAALLADARTRFPSEWGAFLEKTLAEAGLQTK